MQQRSHFFFVGCCCCCKRIHRTWALQKLTYSHTLHSFFVFFASNHLLKQANNYILFMDGNSGGNEIHENVGFLKSQVYIKNYNIFLIF